LALSTAKAAAAGVWYVAPGGSDGNSCSAAISPCATIGAAIGKAASGDTVEVATGTYTGTGGQVVLIDRNLVLSGGWDPSFAAQTGQSVIDGQNSRIGLNVNTGLTASLDRFKIQNGMASCCAGINNNGTLLVSNTTISDNTSTGVGFCYCPIYNNGTLTLDNTTASSNPGGIESHGTLTLDNSTVSNSASQGPAIVNYVSLTLNSSTITGGLQMMNGSAAIQNNIIDICGNAFGGTINSLGYNLVGNATYCHFTPGPGDQLNVDPNLGPILDNGGLNPTQAILPPSPAINAGNPAGCMGRLGLLTTDERGLPRYGVCDIGAFEVQPIEYANSSVDFPVGSSNSVLSYTILLSNPSSASIDGAAVQNTLPSLLHYVDGSLTASGGTPTFSNGVIGWSGSVGAQGKISISYRATIDAAAGSGAVITNPATISAGGDMALRSVSVTVDPTILFSEGFEGPFPGPWRLVDSNGPIGGIYEWGARVCRIYAGNESGWGVGGGANGSLLPCGSNYPNKAISWMIYGPFSLFGAKGANFQYELWLNTQVNHDGVCRLASPNGNLFYGYCDSGKTKGWSLRTLSLKSVPGYGTLLGHRKVWIALLFLSDNTINRPEGAYVDNILLRKCPVFCLYGPDQVDSNQPDSLSEVPVMLSPQTR
jgi:uncharacterized repeat protein (TIGR01451 family)